MMVDYNGLRFDLPAGWFDITDDLPDGSPPSLARDTGVGALQFSIAKYRSGKEPEVTIDDLRALLSEFCQKHEISFNPITERNDKIGAVSNRHITGDELIYALYLSNSRDVLLATYVSTEPENPEVEEDLRGVNRIIKSMEFN
jgi:hypothetical protein